ncbi:DDE-type integrase/transposase/recombinase [Legionella septentrionalis]|uniref:DDE-type integrase/transposase/recombinase n=1 Tax=Legionella septentrionalis TaxID=2498109 RepID=UPI0013159FEF|nr:DDE-type integrase/transposase/recombinase [Legionella septentrionalis]
MLGRQGSKAYQQQYDLLYIRAAEQPNELWQADHVLLDFDVLNDRNKLQKPWLTVIIDDCSRAICGYELSFLSPSAQKTSLCFRHAIWRKSDPDWGIMGVPESFYTDHGSDFTSKHIEQVCIDLKIRLVFSKIGQPRGRGKIERFFRTLSQISKASRPCPRDAYYNESGCSLIKTQLFSIDKEIIPNNWFMLSSLDKSIPFDGFVGSNYYEKNVLFFDFNNKFIYIQKNE